MRRVLLTRPEPGASLTAGILRQMKLEPLKLPLTRIEPLPVEPMGSLADFAAVALTSPNAARHVPPELLALIADLPAYAVGAATAAVARSRGLNVIDESAGDAAGLHQIIAERVQPTAKVLVLCGRVRRNILQAGLLASGYQPHLIEVYDTLPTPPPMAEVSALLGSVLVDVVLVYSAFAADEFTRLFERMPDTSAFDHASFIAISPRVGTHLPAPFRDRVLVAAEPNEEAMLSLL